MVELTFIILANGEGDIAALPMVGDVNIFLKGDPSEEDFEAEVGVMIAGTHMIHQDHHVITSFRFQRRAIGARALRLRH